MKAALVAFVLLLGWVFAIPFCGVLFWGWLAFCAGAIVMSWHIGRKGRETREALREQEGVRREGRAE